MPKKIEKVNPFDKFVQKASRKTGSKRIAVMKPDTKPIVQKQVAEFTMKKSASY
jgi:hypothetical protein